MNIRIISIFGMFILLICAVVSPAHAYDEVDLYLAKYSQASRLSIELNLFTATVPADPIIGIRIGRAHSDSSSVSGMLRSTAHWITALAVRTLTPDKN